MVEKKAVVLFSGGLDSTTCLAYAKAQGFECYALSFDYGQKHCAELEAAKRIAQQAGVVHRQIALTSLGQLGGSALTDAQYEVPEHDETDSIPITYVPARNTIMLAIALGWAEILNADSIFTGVSAIDYSNYPDCRPEYIQAFTTMANLATKRSVEGHSISIETPLIQLTKAQTIELGLSLGVDYSQTVSCYRASGEGLACGTCPSCYLRKKGFLEAGVADVTRYIVTS